jgi:hypothetical protein
VLARRGGGSLLTFRACTQASDPCRSPDVHSSSIHQHYNVVSSFDL